MVASFSRKTNAIQAIFHVAKRLLELFIAILFLVRLNIEGNQSVILLSARFAMLKDYISGGVHGLIIGKSRGYSFFPKRRILVTKLPR